MNILRLIKYFLVLSLLFIITCVVVLRLGLFSESLGPGKITGSVNTSEFVEDKISRQQNAMEQLNVPKTKQILFGDLHVHTTYSADAHQMSLPIVGGLGVHPVSDACDFARHCSALDFWSINDHAEGLTPKRWSETKETIRKCNALNTDKLNPDCVAFLGWEWTQVGANRGLHWGHHNVILKEEADELIPTRAVASKSVTRSAMLDRNPLYPNILFPFINIKHFKRYNDLGRYVKETKAVPICEVGVPSKELPINCHEEAVDPLQLANKVDEYDSDYIIIPHGQTWGLYTPMGYTLDKSLELSKQYPQQFDLLETYSGHGNSEEYRSWRGVDIVREGEYLPGVWFTPNEGKTDVEKGTFTIETDGKERIYDIGTQNCPEPSDNYIPQCWRAGDVIYNRCIDEGIDTTECEQRRQATRELVADRGRAGFNVVPHFTELERNISGQCLDCYSPSMNYVPGGSAQYGLALTKFNDDGSQHRFRYGFISSSDNHASAPGSGYKEIFGTSIDGSGPTNKLFDRLLHGRTYFVGGDNKDPLRDGYVSDTEPIAYDTSELRLGFSVIEWERQRGFFTTGGLAAVHSEGRSKEEIWDAMKRHETYATSGPRILLWFDLINGSNKLPMGSVVEMHDTPTFEVRAMGSFRQKPGCPEDAYTALGEDRVEELCFNECYNPSDERKKITRVEVIRVMPQEFEDQSLEDRIQDAWLTHDCDISEVGCSFTFQDKDFLSLGKDTSYYVRAIEEPSPQINVKGGVCTFDENGECTEFKLCTQDWRHPRNVETCSEIDEPRAWSSPIYVDYIS